MSCFAFASPLKLQFCGLSFLFAKYGPYIPRRLLLRSNRVSLEFMLLAAKKT
jgi:hypothetical protein